MDNKNDQASPVANGEPTPSDDWSVEASDLAEVPPSGQHGLSEAAVARSRASKASQRANRNFADIVAEIDLWRSVKGISYATIVVHGHRENWPIQSSRFKSWLRWRSQLRGDPLLGAADLEKLVGALEAQATYGAPELQTWTRVGETGGRIYVDLGDPDWRCVEISPADMDRDVHWKILDVAPVKFVRRSTMRPMAPPVSGGNLDELRPFLNLDTEADFRLTLGWLIAALRPTGPYPICVITGTQGSGKSTVLRILSRLCDPTRAPERNLPKDERDLFVTADGTFLQTFDNQSRISSPMSDALCRIATGGGFSARALHTNDEEHVLQACRPILINGISALASRGDLADRSIFVTAAALTPDRRQTEEDLWKSFDAIEGMVRGALFNGIAWALRRSSSTPSPAVRMSDAARFMEASAEALGWEAGTFSELLQANRSYANEAVIEAGLFASALVDFLSERDGTWRGSTTELLRLLTDRVDDKARRSPTWPITSAATRAALDRIKDAVEGAGFVFERGRQGPSSQRYIQFSRAKGKAT